VDAEENQLITLGAGIPEPDTCIMYEQCAGPTERDTTRYAQYRRHDKMVVAEHLSQLLGQFTIQKAEAEESQLPLLVSVEDVGQEVDGGHEADPDGELGYSYLCKKISGRFLAGGENNRPRQTAG
jgi:hypothetical protein